MDPRRMGQPVILTKEVLRRMGEAQTTRDAQGDGKTAGCCHGKVLPYSSERIDPSKARQRMYYGLER